YSLGFHLIIISNLAFRISKEQKIVNPLGIQKLRLKLKLYVAKCLKPP
ncbi:MAG: hypothetical protein ACI9HU_001939, partial [Colwellia sp.]